MFVSRVFALMKLINWTPETVILVGSLGPLTKPSPNKTLALKYYLLVKTGKYPFELRFTAILKNRFIRIWQDIFQTLF